MKRCQSRGEHFLHCASCLPCKLVFYQRENFLRFAFWIIVLCTPTYIFQLLLPSSHTPHKNLLTYFRCMLWLVSLLRLRPLSFPLKPFPPARIVSMYNYVISCNTYWACWRLLFLWSWPRLTCWTCWRLLPNLNSVKVKRPLTVWLTLPPSLSNLVLLECC